MPRPDLFRRACRARACGRARGASDWSPIGDAPAGTPVSADDGPPPLCGGALGVEAMSGLVVHLGGSEQLWAHLTTLEEALEMSGVLLALSALGPPRAGADAGT